MRKKQYSKEELIACSVGTLFEKDSPKLPSEPMLMCDNITEICEDKGKYNKGLVIAELNINPDLWFFKCHFKDDAVMPGCLGIDAMWQLLGFYLGWLGGTGKGRALGSDSIKFTGQVLPHNKKVQYIIDISRVIKRNLYIGIADAIMKVDGKLIYEAKKLKVGLFKDTGNF